MTMTPDATVGFPKFSRLLGGWATSLIKLREGREIIQSMSLGRPFVGFVWSHFGQASRWHG
jgi:hypothetical protein